MSSATADTRLQRHSPAGRALHEGAAALGEPLGEDGMARLLAYLALLMRWNRAYRLTAVNEPLELVRRHLLDALSILPHLHGESVLDVGSGAGVPGLVLAVARPECSFTLLDPALKRTRFLIQVVHQLRLPNAEVLRGRLQSHVPHSPYTSVVSRASLPLEALVHGAAGMLAPGGRILAMLGRAGGSSRFAPPPGLAVRVHPLSVPGLDAARHVAVVSAGEGEPPYVR